MNTPSPLIPQGSFQQQKTGGRSSVRIAVVTVVAVHVVFFGGLLMQGCKRDNNPTTASSATNTPKLTLPPIDTNPPPSVAAAPTNPPVETNPPVTAPIVTAPEPGPANVTLPAAGESKEYTIVKGDSLYKIAKANGITIGALTKANPKLNANHLVVGEKIIIPASTKTAAAAPGAAGGGDTAGGYSVKAGDTLTKIAKSHGTTVKALRAANGLKTDRLNVGQKLAIPAAGAAPAATTGTNGAQ